MPKRPKPDIEQVREAMRDHDERVEQESPPVEEPREDQDDPDEDD
jgi:hypothetical protein